MPLAASVPLKASVAVVAGGDCARTVAPVAAVSVPPPVQFAGAEIVSVPVCASNVGVVPSTRAGESTEAVTPADLRIVPLLTRVAPPVMSPSPARSSVAVFVRTWFSVSVPVVTRSVPSLRVGTPSVPSPGTTNVPVLTSEPKPPVLAAPSVVVPASVTAALATRNPPVRSTGPLIVEAWLIVSPPPVIVSRSALVNSRALKSPLEIVIVGFAAPRSMHTSSAPFGTRPRSQLAALLYAPLASVAQLIVQAAASALAGAAVTASRHSRNRSRRRP